MEDKQLSPLYAKRTKPQKIIVRIFSAVTTIITLSLEIFHAATKTWMTWLILLLLLPLPSVLFPRNHGCGLNPCIKLRKHGIIYAERPFKSCLYSSRVESFAGSALQKTKHYTFFPLYSIFWEDEWRNQHVLIEL